MSLRGFTLLELLLALAISGIVLAIGVPSFTEMISNSRRSSMINALVADLNLARNEAIKRAESVTVCMRQANADSCDTSGGTSWNNGWLVFADIDGDAVFDSDNDSTLCELVDDCMLRKHAALDQISLTFPHKRITFSPRGTVNSQGKFVICDNKRSASATVRVLARSGRLRTGTETITCPA